MSTQLQAQDSQAIRETVRNGYALVAQTEQLSCCGPSSCCGADSGASAELLAQSIGYDIEELSALPDGANMGLSCGNPLALASIQPGEVVVDLGSGGGFDIFMAGRRVGATGRAIGVDMTPEMLSKARRNVAVYRERSGLDNVEFRLGEIENLPLADNSVDLIISNCVLNLSPDKPQVWREIARVLKPGGRVSVSDIALVQPLPAPIVQMVAALIGCVAGAVTVDDTKRMIEEAGLLGTQFVKRSDYIDAMVNAEDPLFQEMLTFLPEGHTAGQYITSLSLTAVKPGVCTPGGGCC